jgi:hypothetical protein
MNSPIESLALVESSYVFHRFHPPRCANLPQTPASLTDAREVGSPALPIASDRSRVGDGLDWLIYSVGSGLSPKPIAAAFRFSVSSILAFNLASYSSIDWVTYSWPYLSIR